MRSCFICNSKNVYMIVQLTVKLVCTGEQFLYMRVSISKKIIFLQPGEQCPLVS